MNESMLEPVEGLTPSQVEPSFSPVPVEAPQRSTVLGTPPRAIEEKPSAAHTQCSCGGKAASPQFVYALGRLGYDLISEPRRDSIAQRMARVAGRAFESRLTLDHGETLGYLRGCPWDAAAIEWTLEHEGTPVYAIRPQGPFAGAVYETLREFLAEQDQEKVERVSLPGTLSGKARLLNGHVVPVLVPDMRGVYGWTTADMVQQLVGPAPKRKHGSRNGRQSAYEQKKNGVHRFLERVYHGACNLGVTPQDRAINFAATSAFEIGEIYRDAINDQMELDAINVVRSAICRPGSDCWDVEMYFFYPDRQVQTVRKVYRFTVDVSDVVPVTVGTTRSWFTR